MTFEARHEVERKESSEEKRNAAKSPGLGRRQTEASSNRLQISFALINLYMKRRTLMRFVTA